MMCQPVSFQAGCCKGHCGRHTGTLAQAASAAEAVVAREKEYQKQQEEEVSHSSTAVLPILSLGLTMREPAPS